MSAAITCRPQLLKTADISQWLHPKHNSDLQLERNKVKTKHNKTKKSNILDKKDINADENKI